MKTPFGTEITSPERHRRWPIVVVAAIAASLLIGVAFAASISINGGAAIEFGQGATTVTACDNSLGTPTLTAAFLSNGAGGDSFYVSSVSLPGVDGNACLGKWIRIGLWHHDDAGDALLDYVLFKGIQISNDPPTATLPPDLPVWTLSDTVDAVLVPGCHGATCGAYYETNVVGDARLASGVLSGDVDHFTVETFDTEPTAVV